MEKEIQIIENLKVIAESLNKNWEGTFSECECGAYLIGHPKKCRGCGSSDLTHLEVCLNGSSDSKRAQKCKHYVLNRCILRGCKCEPRV